MSLPGGGRLVTVPDQGSLGIILDIPKMVIGEKAAYKSTKRLLRAEAGAREQEEKYAATDHARQIQQSLVQHEVFKRRLNLVMSYVLPLGLAATAFLLFRGRGK